MRNETRVENERYKHELIHHVTYGEEKSGSSVQHCFWLISRHQQNILSISLSCATDQPWQ